MSDKDKENSGLDAKGKFSVIDLLMIIMVVGVVLTIVIPLRQSRKYEMMVKGSLHDMQRIIAANENFKQNIDGYDYAWDMDLLNLRPRPDTTVFKFALTDTAVVATTVLMGNEPKSYYYHLRDKRFRISEDSKDVIINAWLP